MVKITRKYMLGWFKYLVNIYSDCSNTWAIYIRMVQIPGQYMLALFKYLDNIY